MKKKTIFAATFLSVCGAGLFVGVAGGAEWGTFPCGLIAFATFAFATIASSLCVEVFGVKAK